MWPAGTVTTRDDAEVGATRTLSPGIPSTRLHTVCDASTGDVEITTSPTRGRTAGMSRPSGAGHITTTSPDVPIVGSIDGPMHCVIDST